jgi:hypothetical protein
MENDRLSIYLNARLRAMTYGSDDGLDDEAVRPQPQPTQQQQQPNYREGQLEAAVMRVQELSEQVTAQAKENGLSWLEGYEKVLKNLLDLEEEAAKTTGVEWATTLATAHAKVVRETSEVFVQTLSKQLKS